LASPLLVPAASFFLVWVVPISINTLRSTLPPAGAGFVGTASWVGNVAATRFDDRFILHPATRPARFLSQCAFADASAATLLLCKLPANFTGFLVQVYLDWAFRLSDGTLALRRPITSSWPMVSAGGQPLSLTFAMPTLTAGSARRFSPNAGGYASMFSTPFVFVPPSNAPPNPGVFDVSAMTLSTAPLKSDLLPPAVFFGTEPLFVEGIFPSAVPVQVYLGGFPAKLLQVCTVNQYGPAGTFPARWIICTADALSAGRLAANLNFNVWDPSSLVVAASVDTYSYPYTILVTHLSGCRSAGFDSSGLWVNATFCPTVGGSIMTVVGVNLQPPLTVNVGQFLVPLNRIVVTDPDNFTSFSFPLPAGSGLQLPLSIKSGSSTFTVSNAVSYNVPIVTAVSGCSSATPVDVVSNCHRLGGNVITVWGSNFGSGRVNVLLTGTRCTVQNSSETLIACTLPPMPIGRPLANQVIVVQSSGGLTVADINSISVSYRVCPVGQREAGRNCTACGAGTYTAVGGAIQCTPCDPGRFAFGAGMSSCPVCSAGTFASSPGSTACLDCPVGQYASASGGSACLSCAVLGNFYTALPGLTVCTRCPDFSTVTLEGRCACNEGYYLQSQGNSTFVCVVCPLSGADCIGTDVKRTSLSLRSLAGFWRVPDAVTPRFIKCPLSTAACLSSANGSCAAGYHGPMCGVCSSGYHLSSRACELCTGSANAYLLPVLAVTLVACVALFVFISRRVNLTKLVSAAKVIVSYLQVMGSSSSTYQIPWPDFMQGLLTSFRLALMDVMQVLAVDCWRHLTFYDGFLFTTVTTTLLLTLVPLLHWLAPRIAARWFPQFMGSALKDFRNLLVKCIAIFVRRGAGFGCVARVVICCLRRTS
jgi:hypothetical protein